MCTKEAPNLAWRFKKRFSEEVVLVVSYEERAGEEGRVFLAAEMVLKQKESTVGLQR